METVNQQEHEHLLRDSFLRLLGRPLWPEGPEKRENGATLMDAPFVLLSHTTDEDPVFNYANTAAMKLFEMTPDQIIGLPSRLSAEPLHRDERARLLDAVNSKGFIENYKGIRISSTGRRFLVTDAIVWNLIDDTGRYQGQAATFTPPTESIQAEHADA